MRFLLSLTALLLLAGCASESPDVIAYSLEEQAMVIDDVCLVETKAKEETTDYEDEEVFVTATAAPEEGEQFALSLGNEIEDTLRSLRKKEAFIDRKARFLGYDGK
ncbi:hypothetical protein J6X96_02610 [bacterium]|nr:hypothetical protein [bacterium]